MADSPKDKPSRSAADKERTRQQSRSVNARDAGRRPTSGAGGRGPRPPKGGGSGGSGSGRGGGGSGRGGGGGGRGGGGGGAGRPRQGSSGGRRSPGTLLTWGVVVVVLVIVIVLVLIKVNGGTTKTTTGFQAGPVPASVLHDVTHVPASVFDTVGVDPGTVTVSAPTVQKNQPALTFTGKPGLLFVGGEFCPFCAAERWALVATLSRFGSLSGLQTMRSSSTDIYPNTNTFTFADAKYTSPYLVAVLKEVYGDSTASTGRHPKLESLNKQEQGLVTKYDVTPSSTSSGNIPFMDIGNKAIVSGASYSPSVLQTLTWEQIASGLSNPKNIVTKAIITTSNYQSAAICSMDGGQPGSVCTSSGVTAAAKALGISST